MQIIDGIPYFDKPSKKHPLRNSRGEAVKPARKRKPKALPVPAYTGSCPNGCDRNYDGSHQVGCGEPAPEAYAGYMTVWLEDEHGNDVDRADVPAERKRRARRAHPLRTTRRRQVSAHTPGPWAVREGYGSEGHVVAAGNVELAEVFGVVKHAHSGDVAAIANARLISLAPDLLACAEELLEIAESLDIGDDDGEGTPDVLVRARALLSRARGEGGGA